MSIKVPPDADVYVTPSEYARYRELYQRAYMYYSGTPPTLNEFIRQQQENERQQTQQADRP